MRKKNHWKKSFGLENMVDAFIYSPSFQKYWNFNQKHNIFYKETPVLARIFEIIFGYKIRDYNVYIIAQSHLDAAWLWTVKDSKVRAYKTFYKAIEHIKKYPYFSISMTSPQYFNWIKKYDKKLWEEVKYFVEKNKIDLTGGMWVEPDLNIPSGEALVRQRLYGQLFYLRNFGKISKVESLLDVFGYPNTIPQILKKSGAEYFWTTKLTWNDHTLFPFANFMWRGIDGTEIFTHMFKFNIMAAIDLGLYKVMARRPKQKDLVFNSGNIIDCRSPIFLEGFPATTRNFKSLTELNDKFSKDYVKTVGIFYGFGDGGKGPLPMEIDLMENLARFYHQKHTNTHTYFKILRKDVGDNLITWNDEMYLELHRGCLTTQAKVKKGNRLSENVTIAAEILSTCTMLNPHFEFDYPKILFEDCWQKVMFNQFHDILPGSSIPEVYLLTWKEHEYVIENMDNLMRNILSQIYENVPDNNDKIVVYNPVGVENEAIITVDNLEIPIYNMTPLSINIFEKEKLLDLIKSGKSDLLLGESDSAYIIENENIRVLISKKDGNLKGIQYLSKNKQENIKNNQEIKNKENKNKDQTEIGNLFYGDRNGYEKMSIPAASEINHLDETLLKFKGARIKAYTENFFNNPYPAWNVSRGYTKSPITIKFTGDINVEYNDRDRITLSSKFKFKKSEVILYYTIRAGGDKLEIDTKIDLKNAGTLIKYYIPLNFTSPQVVCETPYGSISRNRRPKTKMEKAKWEFGMQKWLDVGDEDYGLAVFNISKYAASANAKGIAITLVRSPPYPIDPYHSHEKIFRFGQKPKNTDLMIHLFRLALYPHISTWADANIPSKALAYNNPSLHIDKSNKIDQNKFGKFEGTLNEDNLIHSSSNNFGSELEYFILNFPRIQTISKNIIVTSFKPSEWQYISESNIKLTQEKNQEKSQQKNQGGYFSNDYFLPEEQSKWTWDKKTVILRAYESCGIKISTEILLINMFNSTEIESIEEIDLLEWKIYGKLDWKTSENELNNQIISIQFNPFEIKTLRIIIKNH